MPLLDAHVRVPVGLQEGKARAPQMHALARREPYVARIALLRDPGSQRAGHQGLAVARREERRGEDGDAGKADQGDPG